MLFSRPQQRYKSSDIFSIYPSLTPFFYLFTCSNCDIIILVVAASQLELAPLLFDLIKIEDYHPYVAKSEVVGKKTLGVGAKRKLTYRSGSFFYETVVFSDGVESIVFELSQHSFPCPRMFAKISTEKIDDDNSTFIVRLSFEISDDCPEAAAATFEKQIQMLVEQMAINAKAHMEASDKKTRDLDISFEESSVPPNAVSPRSLEEPHFNSRGSDYYKSDLIKVEGTSKSKLKLNQLSVDSKVMHVKNSGQTKNCLKHLISYSFQ